MASPSDAATLPYLAAYATMASSSFVLQPDQQSFFAGDLFSLYNRLLGEQAILLNHVAPPMPSVPPDAASDPHTVPAPTLPSGREASDLFAKLDDGIPINALGATLSPSLPADLAACVDPASFYILLGQVAEQPASLATILTIGWLYKAQRSYALFRDLVHQSGDSRDSGGELLAAYGAHAATRNVLLQQSIEAAYVHQIFAKWAKHP